MSPIYHSLWEVPKPLFVKICGREEALEGYSAEPTLIVFDAHPPFQIDGNFAFTAGVCEILVQSHLGEVHLLPALPDAWPTGSVRGLRARGGFEVDLAWRNGALHEATVRSRRGLPLRVRAGERTAQYATNAGEKLVFDGRLARRP